MSSSPSDSPKPSPPPHLPAKSTPQRMKFAALAAALAWAVPGAGHVLLKRHWRGLVFFSLVVSALIIGCSFHGRLPWQLEGSPLQVLSTWGAMGSGSAFFLLRLVVGYEGDMQAPGYEYGSAFILTAGLMNLLLMLDAWDIAVGRKE